MPIAVVEVYKTKTPDCEVAERQEGPCCDEQPSLSLSSESCRIVGEICAAYDLEPEEFFDIQMDAMQDEAVQLAITKRAERLLESRQLECEEKEQAKAVAKAEHKNKLIEIHSEVDRKILHRIENKQYSNLEHLLAAAEKLDQEIQAL